MQLLLLHHHYRHHKMMIFILILLLAAVLSSEGGAPPIAKSNCRESCGNISIPYPFGIGPDCYLNEWFEVDCNGTKPFLRNLKLEVLSISVDEGTLRVHNPVTFFCNGSHAADLTGSPLVYSQRENRFTAVSCDLLAVMISSSDALVVGGCRSICGKKSSSTTSSDVGEGCDIGVNCCQTTIPPYLTRLNSDYLQQNGSRSPDCNDDYAFLVDKNWFENTMSSDFRAIGRMRSVPVVLEWSLINDNTSSTALFQEVLVELNSSRFDDYSDPTPYCLNSSTTNSANNQSPFSCYCPDGFEGNPYLLQPCQDIDECIKEYRCAGSTCVNVPGWFYCYDVNKKTKTKLVLAGLGAGVGLLLLLIAAWLTYRHVKRRNDIKRKEMFFKRNGGLLLEQQLSSGEVNVDKIKLFKSKELEKSTDNFNNDRILGHGGQGTVYKGMLSDGRIVAVKKSKKVDESKLSEFINEVVILSQINHRNVVKILGCCLETEVPLLVYEFIPNGTLSQYIQEQIEEFPLTWEKRLRIAMEIAGALSYLHSAASFPIYHRDIKSTNILLDEKYRAKIADFGTSRSVGIDQTHLTTQVHGTFGYLDPEYFQSSQFTEKSDVYSFGVVLVELLTGQKPICAVRRSTEKEEYKSLATYFINLMQENRLFNILDAQVLKEGSETEIRVVANLARRCLHLNGKKRPTMREVTAELEAIQMSKKASSNVEVQNYEEVEFVRTESIEPWDVVSTSGGTGSSVFDGGSASSFHEIPLLSFKSR